VLPRGDAGRRKKEAKRDLERRRSMGRLKVARERGGREGRFFSSPKTWTFSHLRQPPIRAGTVVLVGRVRLEAPC